MTLAALGQRLREERLRVGLDQRAMATAGGVSRNSQLAYEAGRTPPSSDYLLAIQKEGIDVAFLFTGNRASAESKKLGLADDADWIMIPSFDLANITDGGKGEPQQSFPIRRDWLNSAIGATTGIWLTGAPCDYPPAGLIEGDRVICRDIAPAELHDRHLCIWREVDIPQLFIGRYSVVRSESIHIDQDSEYWIGRVGVANSEPPPTIFPVGRIVGRPITRIR